MKNKSLILAALFGAISAAACYIQIPLPGGIPIVIQDMMVMITGLLLGPLYGTLAIALFLLLGIIGLPVYSGKAGIHVLISGPTSGFLIGYLITAFIGGLLITILLSEKKEHSQLKQWIVISALSVLCTVLLFLMGIAGFIRVTGKSFDATVAAVVLPFIPGNTIKLFVMIPLVKKFRTVIKNYIG